MTFCEQCVKPCPEHGITYCGTCHKHPGECDFGDCERNATHSICHPRAGTRSFCSFHATSPAFGFARAESTVEEIQP